MANPTDNSYDKARKLIDKVLEPKIHTMVMAFNEHLKNSGLIAIATINWEFHPIKDEKESSNERKS